MLPAQRRSAFVPLVAVVAASCGLNLLDPAAALANGPRQIKFTFNGSIPSGQARYPSTLPANTSITWQFIVQEFTNPSFSVNTYTWTQNTQLPATASLFGPGTLNPSTGVTGTYNSGGQLDGDDDFSFNTHTKEYVFNTSRGATGLSAGGSTITYIGGRGFLPSLTVDTTQANVYDFLVNNQPQQQVIFSCNTSVQNQDQNCNGSGEIDFGEGTLQYIWNSITVENLSTVPGPLPAAAFVGLFTWSRKLRRRGKSRL